LSPGDKIKGVLPVSVSALFFFEKKTESAGAQIFKNQIKMDAV
jgi:hypothetical protein